MMIVKEGSTEQIANSYSGIADYYDLLMTAGYYDYSEQSEALADLIQEDDKVLELGVGTGLLAERLLEQAPEIDFVGIDNTKEMLLQARERLGEDVSLLSRDVVTLDLEDEFDFIFSNGGVWYFIEDGDDWYFCSHLPHREDNHRALERVAAHLAPGGRFVFSIQGVHEDFREELPGGVVYAQEIQQVSESCFDKHYKFLDSGECVAEEEMRYRLFSEERALEMLREIGVKYARTTPGRQYREFVRV